jgi:hypothetical protein
MQYRLSYCLSRTNLYQIAYSGNHKNTDLDKNDFFEDEKRGISEHMKQLIDKIMYKKNITIPKKYESKQLAQELRLCPVLSNKIIQLGKVCLNKKGNKSKLKKIQMNFIVSVNTMLMLNQERVFEVIF